MNIRKNNRVFFDSSVLIAGLASPDGGSAVLLAMAEMRLITPVISEMVVTEVIRNIEKKLLRCLPQYHRLFKSLPFEIADPTEDFIISARKLINEKDAIILAAAMNAKIDFLVTLDRHFFTADLQKLPFTVCSPGELLESVEC
ncbi:MAG: PIN domain-containing protein [Bacillota bacterium]